MNDVIKLLTSHRSIRKFEPREMPDGLLNELIRAGQAAATSSHIQAYSVMRVTDMAKREQLVELSGGQAYVASCSEFLVFCADMKRPLEAAERTGEDVISGMTEQL
ncbi:MAG: nitroreductase family protein, partial [Halomonas sp.]|nr:nitroreductase family protein [Halomonas sp.]